MQRNNGLTHFEDEALYLNTALKFLTRIKQIYSSSESIVKKSNLLEAKIKLRMSEQKLTANDLSTLEAQNPIGGTSSLMTICLELITKKIEKLKYISNKVKKEKSKADLVYDEMMEKNNFIHYNHELEQVLALKLADGFFRVYQEVLKFTHDLCNNFNEDNFNLTPYEIEFLQSLADKLDDQKETIVKALTCEISRVYNTKTWFFKSEDTNRKLQSLLNFKKQIENYNPKDPAAFRGFVQDLANPQLNPDLYLKRRFALSLFKSKPEKYSETHSYQGLSKVLNLD